MVMKCRGDVLDFKSTLKIAFIGVLTTLLFLQGCSDQSKGEFAYPNLFITYENKQVLGLLGFANYTGEINGKIGNSNFGASQKEVKDLEPLQVKPNSIIMIRAEEVKGLDKPTYMVLRYDEDRAMPIVLNKDEIVMPAEEGEYLYEVSVDWGRGDNNIFYWLVIKVQ